MIKYFDFEKPIEDIDNKINDINNNPSNRNENLIKKYEAKKVIFFKDIYKSLTAWQKVQVARHPNRPHTIEYIKNCFSNFVPLSGDKKFSEDEAIIGGLAKIDDISVMVIGTEKGSTMETRIKHNFGMAKPEGYRKFQRLLNLSEKFGFPVITFIDTAGAYPGKEAEERGQSESIASSISKSLQIKVPIISIIIGEGGSGGAIALATADRILMLENAIYSVISPEGCASILWRNIESVQQAAESLKLTAQNCYKLKIIDGIIEEMPGGAHRFSEDSFLLVKKNII
jgi:acetyl-CoA carboxylase, carboxyl transferase, alpha subunit